MTPIGINDSVTTGSTRYCSRSYSGSESSPMPCAGSQSCSTAQNITSTMAHQ